MDERGPNPDAVGVVVAEHMGPILYALELCALSMDEAGRSQDAAYYRAVAAKLAEAGGSPRSTPDATEGAPG